MSNKKEVSAEILASKERMQAIIDNNTEPRMFENEVDLSEDFNSSEIIEHPQLANKIAMTAAKFFRGDIGAPVIVFRSAKTNSVIGKSGMPLPRYHFSYYIECVNENADFKAEFEFDTDTVEGLAITKLSVVHWDHSLTDLVHPAVTERKVLGE